jgi:hypothetical protein
MNIVLGKYRMFDKAKWIVNITILFILTGSLSAQNSQQSLIEVQALVDTSVITIGDQIKYSIIIDRQKDLRIVRPGEGLNLGGFAIKDYTFHDPEERNGRIEERFDFTISVFDTGRYAIPPFPIAYFPNDTSSGQYRIIKASAVDIYVQSVLTGEGAKELKDIKLPRWIEVDYWFWGFLFFFVSLFGVLAWLGWRYYQKTKNKNTVFSPQKPPRPVHEIALDALETLFDSDLIEAKEFKQFYSELTEIIRTYIEGRYQIKALEETSSEILISIQPKLTDNIQFDLLKELLTLADMVKFAKQTPEIEDIEYSKEQATDFVRNTMRIEYAEITANEREDDMTANAQNEEKQHAGHAKLNKELT